MLFYIQLILKLEEKLKDLSVNDKTASKESSPQINMENRQRELELSSNIRCVDKFLFNMYSSLNPSISRSGTVGFFHSAHEKTP